LEEIIRIESNLRKVKKLSFNFLQEIYNEDNQKVCEAEVFCGSIDAETRKPFMLPFEIQKKMIKESS
jgi:acyl-CoA thioesterase FadM